MEEMTVREYAAREGISIGAAYRRVWEGRVNAKQLYGRWLITPDVIAPEKHDVKAQA
jgi:hypothetical protein